MRARTTVKKMIPNMEHCSAEKLTGVLRTYSILPAKINKLGKSRRGFRQAVTH